MLNAIIVISLVLGIVITRTLLKTSELKDLSYILYLILVTYISPKMNEYFTYILIIITVVLGVIYLILKSEESKNE